MAQIMNQSNSLDEVFEKRSDVLSKTNVSHLQSDSEDSVESSISRDEEGELGTISSEAKTLDSSVTKLFSATLPELLESQQDNYILLTSAYHPYHVVYASPAWTGLCGWECEEIAGLDLKFLQGEATDLHTIKEFMTFMSQTGGFGEFEILNYTKGHSPLLNKVMSFPMQMPGGSGKKTALLVSVIVDSKWVPSTMPVSGRRLIGTSEEVGTPLDRREQCNSFDLFNKIAPYTPRQWSHISKSLTLATLLELMVASQAPIILTNRSGEVLHVNVPWTLLTGYSTSMSIKKNVKDFVKDASSVEEIDQLFDWNGIDASDEGRADVTMQHRLTSSSIPCAMIRADMEGLCALMLFSQAA